MRSQIKAPFWFMAIVRAVVKTPKQEDDQKRIAFSGLRSGAGNRTRTRDPLFTKQPLYH